MRYQTYLVILLLAMPFLTKAQQAILTSGGNMSNSTTQVNWTVGETIVESASFGQRFFTAGLNQPILHVITSLEFIEAESKISVYPNPTLHFINIQYEGTTPLKLRILDLNGSELSVSEISDQHTRLDFSQNKSGIYLIELTNTSHKSNIYKVIKE